MAMNRLSMKKIRINAIVDALALVSFVPLVVSGIILGRFWPTSGTGYQGGRNPLYVTDVLGLTHENWVQMHDLTCFIFVVLVAIHLVLHWRFMRHIGRYMKDGELKGEEPRSPQAE
jgi:hypothetical protein